MADAGRVVILNGASSAGKTSIATAFRDRRAVAGDFWLLVGIDDFLAKLPIQWLDLGLPGGVGPYAGDGLRLESTADGQVLRVGAVCRRLLRAYQAAVAAAAHAGMNVIVDDVVVDETAWNDWQTALVGLRVAWVAVQCSLDVAEMRERFRGDRAVGMTRSQAAVHGHPSYDFEIDTTALTRDEAAEEFIRRLRL